jgi:hypothetical protein
MRNVHCEAALMRKPTNANAGEWLAPKKNALPCRAAQADQ